MAQRWDPQEVLDVYPRSSAFTCTGTTKKGTRCGQRMFSRADLSTAAEILDTMAMRRPKSRNLLDELEKLASLTLCPRWHRKPGYSQVSAMVQKWQRMIDNYCASTVAPRAITSS